MASRRWEVLPAAVATEMDDATMVILNLNTKRYFTLNRTAAFVWKGLAAGQSDEEILTAMVEKYDADRTVLRSGFDAIVKHFTEAGLVHEGPQA